MNKRGISDILFNVSMILLVIALISILSVVVFQFIGKVNLSPGENCFDIQINSPIEVKSACYNSETDETEINLFRKENKIPVNSLDFILDNEKWECSDSCDGCYILLPETSKIYYFPEKKEDLTLLINGCISEEIKIKDC